MIDRRRIPRLVLLTPGLGEQGGAAHRSSLVVKGLLDSGWRLTVITRSGTTTRFAIRREQHLLLVEVPGFRNRLLGAFLFYLTAIPITLLFALRADAILAIQLMSTSTVAAVCGSLLARPFVVFSTTSGPLSELTYLRGTTFASFRLWLLRRAAQVIAQNSTVAQELSSIVPESRISVIPNPVAEVKPGPLNGQDRALFSGRFSHEKDLLNLLTAWRAIATERPFARLGLVGAGGEYRSVEAELKSTVAADGVLRSSVTFIGWVPDVAPYLEASDVYIFPSLSEGMSNALLEACAFGRVVVASDIPANRAVLGDDYPFLFAAGDAVAMERGLRTAFDDNELRALAVTMIKARLVEFQLKSVIARIEGVIAAASHSACHQHS